jgi:NAD(P)-dependent dehydrogenase (short-subunit alcohol dehydrogenase family)
VTSLLAAGFQVAAHDRGFTNDGVRAEFQSRYPEALLSGEPEPEALVEAVWSGVGPLEVVVSNDHHPARHADVEAADVGDLQTTLDMLVVRPFRLVKAIVPRFRALNRGRIVMVTSCRTKLPVAGGAIPDAARDAANALVRSLAIDLAPQGIPINAVAPNYLYSEAYYPRAAFIDSPSGRAYVETVVPAGRLGRQEEIGEVIAFLATNQASFLTGAIVDFAGGWPVAPGDRSPASGIVHFAAMSTRGLVAKPTATCAGSKYLSSPILIAAATPVVLSHRERVSQAGCRAWNACARRRCL